MNRAVIAVLTTCLLLALCMTSLAQDAGTYEEGEAARLAGDLNRAYTIFSGLLREDPGNAAINFAYGMTCFALNEHSHARLAFERVLEINPDNDRARVELGRTYMAMNQPELARREFEKVLAHDPPPKVRENIRKWLAAAKSRQQKWEFTFRMDAGAFVDDNVNVGPDAENISIAPIIYGSQTITELALGEDSQPVDSWGSFVSLAASTVRDVGEKGHWSLVGNLAYYQNFLDDQPDYESMYAQLTVGPQIAQGAGLLRLPAKVAHISNGGEPLVNIYGVSPQLAVIQGPASEWQWITASSFELRDYDSLDNRDGVYLSLGQTVKRVFGRSRHDFSMGLTVFHDFTEEAIYEHTGVKWTAGVQFVLPPSTRCYARLQHTEADYEEQEVLSPVARKDTRRGAVVGVNHRLGANWGLDLNHQQSDSDSSFPLYEYERQVTTISAFCVF